MLLKIEGLSGELLGVRAEGRVTRDDYEKVMIPLLEERYAEKRRVRFLYEIGPDFLGFTLGAAFDDFRVGMHFLRLFEMCAIVTDVEWIRHASKLFGAFMPCPVNVFKITERDKAIAWLTPT